jgi:hypothetical protein
MKFVVFLLLFSLLKLSATTIAAGKTAPNLVAELQSCLQLPTDAQRLTCYDRLARDNTPPDYAGKLGYTTEPFVIDHPQRVRFRSQGVIFVLYVLDHKGDVVQNLHLGGGGEGSYVIQEAGRYRLQIDGSAHWQIWIEPLTE